MCDACINAAVAHLDALSDEQRAAVERYIDLRVEKEKEELDSDHSHMVERMEQAHLIVCQLNSLLGEHALTLHTPIDELVLHVQNYARTIELLDELTRATEVR